jgi:virginiamycin B lyase
MGRYWIAATRFKSLFEDLREQRFLRKPMNNFIWQSERPFLPSFKKPHLARFPFLVASLLLLASLSHAATITGTVTGPDSEPFKGAFVQAQNLKTKITVMVLSNKDGRYRIENLPAGDYDVQIRAIGYKTEPRTGLNLNSQQAATAQFILQKATVLWSDLSIYQGEVLLPNLPGKRILLTDGTTPIRDSPCQICHSFQNKMAPWVRDEAGWRSRVDYMRQSIRCCGSADTSVSDKDEDVLVSYLTSLFGPNSILPASPTDDPKYKSTVRTFNDDAMNIVYVEYELPGPNRMPWSAVPDGHGSEWMPYKSDVNKIGRLNEETGVVDEFKVPGEGVIQIHSVYPASDGSIWLTEMTRPGKLGRWDPKTEQITDYADTVSKHTVRAGPNGVLCSTGTISLFDSKTEKYTHFDEKAFAYGAAFDKEGNCWFTEYDKEGKIGKIDTKTDTLQMWTTPTAKSGRQVYSRRIDIDKQGLIWFDESEAGQVGRFDPKTQTFKEFPLPGPMATPYGMNLDRDEYIWYASEYMDVLGRMDPKSGKTVEYPFPHAENTIREFFLDSQGRNWYATPSNNKVGYFYLAGK